MTACSEQPYQPTLKATYNKPAKNWESEALPIGNGYMGAMIFGDVYVDVIQTNEHTLWSGGPGEDPSYNGGHPVSYTHLVIQSAWGGTRAEAWTSLSGLKQEPALAHYVAAYEKNVKDNPEILATLSLIHILWTERSRSYY